MSFIESACVTRALFSATRSMMQSLSKNAVSFSIAINMKLSRCSCDAVLLNRFLINFKVEKLCSQAT